MNEFPQVCLIKDLTPDNPATLGALSYKNLATTAMRFEHADTAFLGNVWQAEYGSVEEIDAAMGAKRYAALPRLARRNLQKIKLTAALKNPYR